MKVLVAFDDSSCSRAALARVADAAWARDASVVLLTVLPAALEEAAQRAEIRLRAAGDALRAKGLVVATRVRRGDPELAIVDAAEEERADLVVVGSHGRSGVSRPLLGSVASHVVAHCRRDVLVVHDAAGSVPAA